MPLKIVRNDITKMNTEAIVNTANELVKADTGCDIAIYRAAGYEELLEYRRVHIGIRPEGDVFITPGFNLDARFIIHAVSPLFINGKRNEEEKLRGCYSKVLKLAAEYRIKSISFPLISTGSFGYPLEEGMRIAVDEINAFLETHDMLVYIVVFGEEATELGKSIYPELDEFINLYYVSKQQKAEYEDVMLDLLKKHLAGRNEDKVLSDATSDVSKSYDELITSFEKELEEKTIERPGTFSELLIDMIDNKGMEYSDVYSRAMVDRKLFSKIKNNPEYHPQKITVLCLCIGAKLDLIEAKELLSRAGYALSPSDITDIIFAFFIENKHYSVIDIDIQLENYGLPCIIK